MDRCVNCGITGHTNTLGRRQLHDEKILLVIQRWLAPLSVNSRDYVCQSCWDLAQNPHVDDQGRPLGLRNVCLHCGRSLASQTHHILNTNTTRETKIYNVIQEWIIPQTIQPVSQICHTCWVAADRAAVHMVSSSSTSSQDCPQNIQPLVQDIPTMFLCPNEGIRSNQPEPTIVLPDYMRAETEYGCFIEGCQRTERQRVPLSIRKMLLLKHKYYIPENNRYCEQHLIKEPLVFLDYLRSNYVESFTARHIQDMMSLK